MTDENSFTVMSCVACCGGCRAPWPTVLPLALQLTSGKLVSTNSHQFPVQQNMQCWSLGLCPMMETDFLKCGNPFMYYECKLQ